MKRRISHTPWYLHKTGLTNSPMCTCSKEQGDINHIFLQCVEYKQDIDRLTLQLRKIIEFGPWQLPGFLFGQEETV